MILKDLIAALEKCDPAAVVANGFARAHSYRGDYSSLAFEPAPNVTVAAMLQAARDALGNTFTGYKGGDFEMSEYTDVYLAEYGMCGEYLGERLLSYMLSGADSGPAAQLIDARKEIERLKATNLHDRVQGSRLRHNDGIHASRGSQDGEASVTARRPRQPPKPVEPDKCSTPLSEPATWRFKAGNSYAEVEAVSWYQAAAMAANRLGVTPDNVVCVVNPCVESAIMGKRRST